MFGRGGIAWGLGRESGPRQSNVTPPPPGDGACALGEKRTVSSTPAAERVVPAHCDHTTAPHGSSHNSEP